MIPDSGDICTCGHSYGSHSRDTIGPCTEKRDTPCTCPHWRQPVWDMAGELHACLAEEAHIYQDNPAAHDCYQIALQALEPVRAAIERARKAQHDEEQG